MPGAVLGETSGTNSPTGPRPISPEDTSYNVDAGRESLSYYISRLYGEETCQSVKFFEKLRKKKARLLSSLTFLLRCRDTGTTPSFLKIKRLFGTAQAHRIYDRAEHSLLRERIHFTRKELATTDWKLLDLHYSLSYVVSPGDWEKIDNVTYYSLTSIFNQATSRHKKKFLRHQEACSTPTLDTTLTVVNLTDRTLSQAETSLLAKGGNFAVTPRSIPIEDIIANVEASIRNLPPEQAEEIRCETSHILRKAPVPKTNLTIQERKAINTLNEDESIIILPADKGNATVIMDMVEYKTKISELLDPETYKKLPRDPTARYLRHTNNLIKASSLPDDVKKTLYKSEALPPRLYGLPKIHKANVPLRPIVSAIGSPTYDLGKLLSSLLQPYIGKTPTYIRDSGQFIKKLKDIHLEAEDRLVSFDVVSLFTKVPLREALDHIKHIFPEDITKLFDHCLTTSYTQWDNQFYEQKDGVAMGSPLSPVIANFYMEKFEQTMLESAPFKPKTWLRYVDDTFVIWGHGDEALEEFLAHINNLHPNIQFTMEKEQNNSIAFLDVLVSRTADLYLDHTVYRKPTHTDRYLHKTSNHHPRQKFGVIKSLMDRAIRVCGPTHIKAEIGHLHSALCANGYGHKEIQRAIHPRRHGNREDVTPRATAFLPYINRVTDRIGKILGAHGVKTIYKPTRKIRDLLKSAKDERHPHCSAGVYRIPCSCGQVYIGTTMRSIATRIKEHCRHSRLGQIEKSAVVEHALSLGHDIDFKNTEVLSTTTHYHSRLQREAIEIFKHSNNFNRKEEALRVNKTWIPVLKNTYTK